MQSRCHNKTENQSLKRDVDLPMTLPPNANWDVYSTVKEPDAPNSSKQPENVEVDEVYNQWENNYN